MAVLQTIKDAQALYEQKQYGECIEICKQLMNNEDDSFEAYLLLAKCGIMVTDPSNDETVALDITLANASYEKASTVYDYFRVKEGLRDAIAEKEIAITHKYFSYFRENPQSLSEFLHLYQQWIGFTAIMIMQVDVPCTNSIGSKLAKKEGYESEKDAYEHYTEKSEKKNVEGIIAQEAFEAAWDVFEKSKAQFENNKDANADFLFGGFVTNTILNMTACETLIDFLAMKGIGDSVKLVRLKKLAEMRDYMLRAECYPNGGAPISLMQASREKTLQDLEKTYEEIIKLDPEFEHPELPSVEAKKNNSTVGNASGGCYVATAVYGSYDCPEVWTLRRYRDFKLAKSLYGRLFIRFYYAVSPTLVRCFGSTKLFKNLWKPYLDKMVKRLRTDGFEDTPYDDRTW